MPASPDSVNPPPWTDRRVIAYAHQGGAWEAPSSTLHAIRSALDAGATAIELDVHATSDGQLVVCHDATVDRTTEGTGRIAELSAAELATLDNAYWWAPGADVSPGLASDRYPYRGRAPGDRRFGIALLEEVLEEFAGVVLNLDIKQTAPVVEPYEEKLAAMLHRFGRVDDVIVASFIEIATSRPPPAASIRGTTARATRNEPVTFVSTTSRNPSAVTSQNACGWVRKRGLTLRMPFPALLISSPTPPSRS